MPPKPAFSADKLTRARRLVNAPRDAVGSGDLAEVSRLRPNLDSFAIGHAIRKGVLEREDVVLVAPHRPTREPSSAEDPHSHFDAAPMPE